MEPAAIITVPISKTVDFNKIEDTAACLELIEESKEKSPNKERSKTPLMSEYEQSREPLSTESVQQIFEIDQKVSDERDKSQQKSKSPNDSLCKDVVERTENTSKATEVACNKKSGDPKSKVPNESDTNVRNETYVSQNMQQLESTQNDFKKLKEKALSLDSELLNEVANAPPVKPVERRRSKIFETAEKFNQLSSTAENEKPKKIFIPGVNVGGAKRAFERKASLSSVIIPPPTKASKSKVIIDVPTKKDEKDEQKQTLGDRGIMEAIEDKLEKRDEAKKRAIDIISGAIGKPPMQKKLNGSPPQISPDSRSPDSKKHGLKIQVAPNDVRSATVSISTPIETKFGLDVKPTTSEATVSMKKMSLLVCFIFDYLHV